ncbi:NAD(P)/FAD-dependent oxidoreductase [Paenibacillus sp. MBLB4367]|uniref:NAD(P)/FAD-dependent oxidoreductase n=1 Tax=Paenibacillus sp. MBLB4367 TaxID=3384767 RepID=UPI00390824CA
MNYDCAIIGGGPAGLNAALMLGRARRNIVLFDNGKPRNAVTHESHGFITRDGINPAEFRRIAYDEVARYPSVTIRQQEVKGVNRTVAGFAIVTESGEPIMADKVILASGLKEEFPPIGGLHDLYGKSLFTCPYCDGWELRDKPLVIVSESPHAMHIAKLVYNWSRDLIVCTNGKFILTTDEKQKLLEKEIKVNEQPIAAFEGRNGMLEQVRFTDGTAVERVGGFVTPVWVPAPFGERLGCEIDNRGGIVTDALGRTSIKGIYAAGDASVIAPSQLIIAAAGGSRAAIGVNTDLMEETF